MAADPRDIFAGEEVRLGIGVEPNFSGLGQELGEVSNSLGEVRSNAETISAVMGQASTQSESFAEHTQQAQSRVAEIQERVGEVQRLTAEGVEENKERLTNLYRELYELSGQPIPLEFQGEEKIAAIQDRLNTTYDQAQSLFNALDQQTRSGFSADVEFATPEQQISLSPEFTTPEITPEINSEVLNNLPTDLIDSPQVDIRPQLGQMPEVPSRDLDLSGQLQDIQFDPNIEPQSMQIQPEVDTPSEVLSQSVPIQPEMPDDVTEFAENLREIIGEDVDVLDWETIRDLKEDLLELKSSDVELSEQQNTEVRNLLNNVRNLREETETLVEEGESLSFNVDVGEVAEQTRMQRFESREIGGRTIGEIGSERLGAIQQAEESQIQRTFAPIPGGKQIGRLASTGARGLGGLVGGSAIGGAALGAGALAIPAAGAIAYERSGRARELQQLQGGEVSMGEATGIDAQIAMMSLSPHMSREEASRLVEGVMSSGFVEDEFDEVLSTVSNNFENFGMDVDQSLRLIESGVEVAGGSLQNLERNLSILGNVASDTRANVEDLQDAFEAYQEQLAQAGAGEATQDVSRMLATIGADSPVIEQDFLEPMLQQLSDPTSVASGLIARELGVTAPEVHYAVSGMDTAELTETIMGPLDQVLEQHGLTPESIANMSEDELRRIIGSDTGVIISQILQDRFGISLNQEQLLALVQDYLGETGGTEGVIEEGVERDVESITPDEVGFFNRVGRFGEAAGRMGVEFGRHAAGTVIPGVSTEMGGQFRARRQLAEFESFEGTTLPRVEQLLETDVEGMMVRDPETDEPVPFSEYIGGPKATLDPEILRGIESGEVEIGRTLGEEGEEIPEENVEWTTAGREVGVSSKIEGALGIPEPGTTVNVELTDQASKLLNIIDADGNILHDIQVGSAANRGLDSRNNQRMNTVPPRTPNSSRRD